MCKIFLCFFAAAAAADLFNCLCGASVHRDTIPFADTE